MQLFHGIYDTWFNLIPNLRREIRDSSAEISRLSQALAAKEEELKSFRANAPSHGNIRQVATEATGLSQTLAAREAEIRKLQRMNTSRMERINDLQAEVSRLARIRGSREKEIASAVTWELAMLRGSLHSQGPRVVYREVPPKVIPPVYTDIHGEEVVCSEATVRKLRTENRDFSAIIEDLSKTIAHKDELANMTAKMHAGSSQGINIYLNRINKVEGLLAAAEARVAELEKQLETRGEEAIDEFRQGPDFNGILLNAGVAAVRAFVSGITDSLPEQAALLEQLSDEFAEVNAVPADPVLVEGPVSPTRPLIEEPPVNEEPTEKAVVDPEPAP